MRPEGTARPRVLLVEDDPSNALTLTALLEDLDYSVETADSFSAAQHLVGRGGYALVLLDYHLGDGVGSALVPRILPTPVVLLTGARELREPPLGLAAIHIKGADPEELLAIVRRLLGAPPAFPPPAT